MAARVLIIIVALLCVAILGGCSALICSPWDPKCDVNKDCSVNACKVRIKKIECDETCYSK